MKTIVTLVDFSDVAFKLLKHAHALAKAFDCQVVLLHVVPQEPVVVGFGIAPTIMTTPSDELIEEDTKKLKEMEESLSKFGVKVSSDQLYGATVDSVLNECKRLNADLIIVGSHSHGALYNLFVGSITADVLKRTECPVLVVPETSKK